MNLTAFAKLMKKRADDLPKNVNDVKKDVSKAVLSTTVLGTPVDTSKALSNWQIGINTISAPVREPRVPGRLGSTRMESARATIAAGERKIDKVRPEQEVHISNGVDYIKPLNNGTLSRQPGGFVERAVLVGRERVRKAKVIRDEP